MWNCDGELEESIQIDMGTYQTAVFSYDSQLLGFCNMKAVQVFEIDSQETIMSTEKSSQFCLAFSKDNRLIASGVMTGSIYVYKVQGGEIVCELNYGRYNTIWALDFSYDGQYLISGQDQLVKLWDMNLQKAIREFVAHSKGICDVRFSVDGWIASSSYDGSVKIWEDQRLLHSVKHKGGFSRKLEFIESGIVTGNNDNSIICWDLDFDD